MLQPFFFLHVRRRWLLGTYIYECLVVAKELFRVPRTFTTRRTLMDEAIQLLISRV